MPMTKPSKDFVARTKEILDMILKITGIVYRHIETSIDTSKGRDQLNLAAIVTDNAIIDIATTFFLLAHSVATAKIELDAFGNIEIEAQSISDVSALTHDKVNTPTTAFEKIAWNWQVANAVFDAGDIISDIVNFIIDKATEPEETVEEL